MKHGNISATTARAFATGALALALYQPAVASETGRNVSMEVNELHNSTSSAELYLMARGGSFRSDLDEAEVVRMGCRYVADSAADVDSLIDLLVNAELVQVQANKYGYDARIVIRLYQGQGDKRPYTLVLSHDYYDANAQGEYYRRDQNGAVSTIPVEAKNGTERELRFWAAQHRLLATKPRCRDE